jgi:hypothetical protein
MKPKHLVVILSLQLQDRILSQARTQHKVRRQQAEPHAVKYSEPTSILFMFMSKPTCMQGNVTEGAKGFRPTAIRNEHKSVFLKSLVLTAFVRSKSASGCEQCAEGVVGTRPQTEYRTSLEEERSPRGSGQRSIHQELISLRCRERLHRLLS